MKRSTTVLFMIIALLQTIFERENIFKWKNNYKGVETCCEFIFEKATLKCSNSAELRENINKIFKRAENNKIR